MKRRDMLLSAPFAASILSCSGSSDSPLTDSAPETAAVSNAGITVPEGADADGLIGIRAEKTARMLAFDPDYSYDMVIRDSDNMVFELKKKYDRNDLHAMMGRMRFYAFGTVISVDITAVYSEANKTILVKASDPFMNQNFSQSFQLASNTLGKATLMYDGLEFFYMLTFDILQNKL